MTATILAFPVRPEGRPSNATLSAENRALRTAVETLTTERDELDAELTAWVSERIAVASETAALARRGRLLADAGRSPVAYLDAITRLAHREQVRAMSARATEGDAA